MKLYNVLDIETLRTSDEVGGWGHKPKMGIACAVLHSYNNIGEIPDKIVYTDVGISIDGFSTKIVDDLFKDLQSIPHTLVSASEQNLSLKYLIGHNLRTFDLVVVDGEYRIRNKTQWNDDENHFNMLEDSETIIDTIWFNGRKTYTKLQDLCVSTLGQGKTGDGALAPIKWREGKYEEVIKYCDNDVDLTRRLYEFYVKNGYVILDDEQLNPGWTILPT